MNETNSLHLIFQIGLKYMKCNKMAVETVILLLPTSVKIQWVQHILHRFLSVCVYLYMPPIYSYISIYTQLTFMYICYENV